MRIDPAAERGQVTPLILVALLFATLLAVGIAHVGAAASQRAAAQTAADAAALAGAAEGEDAALAVAKANGAELEAFEQRGGDVVVRIERRGATATARARWQPLTIP